MILFNLYLTGAVPSSKNGRSCISGYSVASAQTQKWRLQVRSQFKKHAKTFRDALPQEKPIFMGFHFVRTDKRKFDFINPVQALQDMMVSEKWIEDDHSDLLLPIPWRRAGMWYQVNKNNPGVLMGMSDNPMDFIDEIDGKLVT